MTPSEAIEIVRAACQRYDHRGTLQHDPRREPLAERIVLDELDRLRERLELAERVCLSAHAYVTPTGESVTTISTGFLEQWLNA